MAFIEAPRFPDNISYGAVSGPEFQTDVIVVNSGYESRNANWEQSRARYDVGHKGRSKAATDELIAFFRNTQGRAQGFRFKDWTDFQVSHANGRLKKLPRLNFQCQKQYSIGASRAMRDITKLISVDVKRNGVIVSAGSLAGQYALDKTRGLLQFVPDAVINIAMITQGLMATVTTVNAHGLRSGMVVDFAIQAGMTPLNDASAIITVVSPTSFTVPIDTTHYPSFSGGGTNNSTLRISVQPDEILTWQGEFDVPARFDTDAMHIEVIDKDIYSWGQIPIVEIRV